MATVQALEFEWWDWSNIEGELADPSFFLTRESRYPLSDAPRVASMFAGCGGMDLGLAWAGYEIVYANEIDHVASATYERNLGLKVDTRPVEEVDVETVPDHDLLVGGFPCQPFSYAGKRDGLRDPRGMLFFSLVDVLDAKRPNFFIFENVKGLRTHAKGETFRSVSKALTDIGYRFEYGVLNALRFGCSQQRERIFLVGIRDDLKGQFAFPSFALPMVSVKDAIDDLVGRTDVPNNEPMKHTSRILERYKHVPQGGSLADVPAEHQQRKRGAPHLVSGKQSTQSYRRMREGEPSPTVCAMFQAHFIHYSQDRNLTAREAARLQSFPDDFVFEGKRTVMSWEDELSQYAQIGNAVAPRVAYALGRGLYEQVF